MIIRNCTTRQIPFIYLAGRQKTEVGSSPDFKFSKYFLMNFKPSGKKGDIHINHYVKALIPAVRLNKKT